MFIFLFLTHRRARARSDVNFDLPLGAKKSNQTNRIYISDSHRPTDPPSLPSHPHSFLELDVIFLAVGFTFSLSLLILVSFL